MASTAPISAISPNAPSDPQPRQPAPEQAAPTPAESQATRLLIQEVAGRYVYTVIDRDTGRVIAQLPRQQVQEMGGLDSYNAGAMVNTKA